MVVNCSIPQCYGVLANNSRVCSGNGNCIAPNTCKCNVNWFGEFCNVTKCFDIFSNSSKVCSTFGSCLQPDKCKCNPWKSDSMGTPSISATIVGNGVQFTVKIITQDPNPYS